MTDEEFEQWKIDNGWYFTWPDVLSIIGLMAFLIVLVKIG